MSTRAPAVLTQRQGSIWLVQLNRPRALNALDQALVDALVAALANVNQDPAIDAVVLSGAGDRAFSVGLDMRQSAALDAGNVEPWLRGVRRYFQAIRDVDKPVVAAVNGVAMGLGLQTALHCDLRLAHPGVTVSQPEVRAGVPSVLGHMILSTIVGHARAVELSLTCRSVGAAEALDLGIFHALHEPGELLEQAIALAAELGRQPRTALRLSKQRFRETTQAAFDEAVETAIEMQKIGYASGEPHAFARQFLAQRRVQR